MNEILNKLNIKDENFGACIGGGNYIQTTDSGKIDSYNPTNGKLLATVNLCSENDYEEVIKSSEKAFDEWRMVPAPIRGELIRKMGNALREHKSALGELVSLEMFKIKDIVPAVVINIIMLFHSSI